MSGTVSDQALPTVLDGWKLVPLRPTPAMLRPLLGCNDDADAALGWMAALYVAPSAPDTPQPAAQPGMTCERCGWIALAAQPSGQAQTLDSIQRQADDLIAAARQAGVVVRIDLVPRQPLAMGSLDMVADARVSRASQASGGA